MLPPQDMTLISRMPKGTFIKVLDLRDFILVWTLLRINKIPFPADELWRLVGTRYLKRPKSL